MCNKKARAVSAESFIVPRTSHENTSNPNLIQLLKRLGEERNQGDFRKMEKGRVFISPSTPPPTLIAQSVSAFGQMGFIPGHVT